MAEKIVLPSVPLGEVLARSAERWGDLDALQFEGRRTTYAELSQSARRVASALVASGCVPGDRIGYLGKNTDTFFHVFFAAALSRTVITPVNWRLAPGEIAFILRNSQAKILFLTEEFAPVITAMRDQLPDLCKVVVVDGAEADFDAWRDEVGSSGDALPVAAKEDVVLQLYTSGTTGLPKGAMLQHQALVAEFNAWDGEYAHWDPGEPTLHAMPLFHIAGICTALRGVGHGVRCIVDREFKPDNIMAFIRDERLTRIVAVPSALQILLSHPDAASLDFSSLRYIYYGASPIQPELLRQCMETFQCGFVQGYGMTETSGPITMLAPSDHTVEDVPRMRSAGRALPGVEIAIADADGNFLPVGQTGEILIRSACNMIGYWGLDEETRMTLDAEGWLHTGDAGSLDGDGFLTIRDRIKDMIITGGENVYPAEVEAALIAHPKIVNAAVIGVPDAKWGEAVKGVVIPVMRGALEERELIDWVRRKIAGFKAPKTIDFVDTLPCNASGKVLRRELRNSYALQADDGWDESGRRLADAARKEGPAS